ncbi:unnamed protein product [Rotaria sp. Silwood1]|nr:unnamed protein product [Rotaria sp. Silwood1]
MDTQNIVGSTSAASGDNNNNNFPQQHQRSNGNTITSSYEGNYQVDISSTNFELETITSSYTGLMRIYRLLYVADHCPMLRNDALLTSFKYIQETHFISLYKQVKQENFSNQYQVFQVYEHNYVVFVHTMLHQNHLVMVYFVS